MSQENRAIQSVECYLMQVLKGQGRYITSLKALNMKHENK